MAESGRRLGKRGGKLENENDGSRWIEPEFVLRSAPFVLFWESDQQADASSKRSVTRLGTGLGWLKGSRETPLLGFG